jgi:serine/threonine protein kinase
MVLSFRRTPAPAAAAAVLQARSMADFLLPMLHFDPDKRSTAAEALKHPWLQGPPSEEEAADAGEERRQQRRRSSHKRSSSPSARDGSGEDKRVRYTYGGHNGRVGHWA